MRYDKEYADNGYFVIEGAIAAADLESIMSAAQTIIDDFDVDQHRSVFSTLHRDTERDQYFIDSAEAVHCFLEEDAVDEDGRLTRAKDLAINKIGHAMHDPAHRCGWQLVRHKPGHRTSIRGVQLDKHRD